MRPSTAGARRRVRVTATPLFRRGQALAFLCTGVLATSLRSADSAVLAFAELTYSGDQQVLEALDREIGAAGTDLAKLALLEQRLLDVLRRSDATYAARQAAAQRLGLVLASNPLKHPADAHKPLRAMLADERDSDLARLALEPVPGDAIDTLFVAALAKTTGRARLGLLDSIGRRRIVAAVPGVAPLLRDPEAETATAAARALGFIGHVDATAALQTVPEPSAPGIASAKLEAAARLGPGGAMSELLSDLQRNARDPVHRAAAFRLTLKFEPSTAAARIAEVLGGESGPMKQVALEAIHALPAGSAVPALAGKLSTWDPSTQSAVIAALGRRGDAAATAVIVTAAGHSDAEVRTAAIEALGALPGGRDTASLLAKIASGPDTDNAKAARQSLARLNGPEVSATILAGAERGEASIRVVYLEQLALRNLTEGMPLLLKTRSDANATVRAAAVSALGDLAGPAEQKALLDWAIEASTSDEQTRALRAVVNVTLRNPRVEERGRAIYAVVESAQPDLALRLLPALGRIGGVASANCAARLALRTEPRVAAAATATLARWPDASGLPALAVVAQKAALPASRTAAIDGVIEYLERHRDPWSPQTTALLARTLASTQDGERRQKLVGLLHRADDPAALTLVEGFKSDDALGPKAGTAADVIRANLAGRPTLRASSPAGLSNIMDGKTSTRWSVPALGEEWVEIDFRVPRPVTRITLDQTGRPAEFPEHYEIFITDDLAHPGPAIASGSGQRNRTVIDLPAGTRGRYAIVRNTAERTEAAWAICELYID